MIKTNPLNISAAKCEIDHKTLQAAFSLFTVGVTITREKCRCPMCDLDLMKPLFEKINLEPHKEK